MIFLCFVPGAVYSIAAELTALDQSKKTQSVRTPGGVAVMMSRNTQIQSVEFIRAIGDDTIL